MFHPNSRNLLLSVIAGLVLVASCATTASAATQPYCGFSLGPYDECYGGSHVSLTDNYVIGSSYVGICAAANTTSGTFYGHYFCANGSACHDYSGTISLQSILHNRADPNFASGTSYYAGQRRSGCPRGGPVSRARSSASPQAASIPALQASPERAPSNADAAELRALLGGDVDTAGARSVPGLEGQTWVVPVPRLDQVCLVMRDVDGTHGYTCASTADTAAGRLYGLMEPGAKSEADTRSVAAVVPDGTTTVALTGPATETRRPVRGVLTGRIDGTVIGLAYDGRSGPQFGPQAPWFTAPATR